MELIPLLIKFAKQAWRLFTGEQSVNLHKQNEVECKMITTVSVADLLRMINAT